MRRRRTRENKKRTTTPTRGGTGKARALKVLKFGLATALVTQAIVCAKNGGALPRWVPTWVRDAVDDRPTTTAAVVNPKNVPFAPAMVAKTIPDVVNIVAGDLLENSTCPWNKTSPDGLVRMSDRLARSTEDAVTATAASTKLSAATYATIGVITVSILSLIRKGLLMARGGTTTIVAIQNPLNLGPPTRPPMTMIGEILEHDYDAMWAAAAAADAAAAAADLERRRRRGVLTIGEMVQLGSWR